MRGSLPAASVTRTMVDSGVACANSITIATELALLFFIWARMFGSTSRIWSRTIRPRKYRPRGERCSAGVRRVNKKDEWRR